MFTSDICVAYMVYAYTIRFFQRSYTPLYGILPYTLYIYAYMRICIYTHIYTGQPYKCVWAQKEIKYLGHIVNASGVKPDPAKVKALDNWNIPPECDKVDSNMSQLEKSTIRKRTIHEVRRFLGFMNYFNRFIPKYAELAGPLHAQTSDKAESWSAECTANWNTLRKLLSKATMMYHPVFDLPFHVYPDASMLSIGGCLMQMHNGISQPIAFIARKLLPAEQRYTTTEQEMLAMVYCFQKWRCYLDGSTVIVHTDHEPLTWLQTQPRPSHR